MSFRRILFEVRDSIATITLNRPEQLNAIDDDMREDFGELGLRLADDAAIRVVVFAGAGRAFCSGGSVEHFDREWNTAAFRAKSRRLSAFFDELEMLEKPVIAAIHGSATGAGLQLALACDLRFAAEGARLGYREHRLGLVPGHGGATRLVKLIGLSRAKQLYFAGDLASAEEAFAAGLVHAVVPADRLMDETYARARMLVERAPLALGLTKRLLNAAADVDVHAGHALEALAQSVALKTSDHREGVRAFREKRDPRFHGE
ncbi:MAG: enoyl-CoA hydratase/isomerase family protein [Candidatus Eiseniibacteriota bacterium]